MKILKDRSVFENDKATCYHHIGDEHFAMVVHDYVIFDQIGRASCRERV